jgi:hypothetical protein
MKPAVIFSLYIQGHSNIPNTVGFIHTLKSPGG